jgi:membrane-bound metal-dependent hydrolase YbcI (DUF457 family)
LLYNNEIDAMLFHRGFMHSILFSVLAAFLLDWLVHKLYDSGKRLHAKNQKDWIKLFFWSVFTHPIYDCFTPYGTQPSVLNNILWYGIAETKESYHIGYYSLLDGSSQFSD